MSYFRLDPTAESCSTQLQLPTLWPRRSILVRVNISARTLVTRHGVTSTTLGCIGKTVEVVETRAVAPPSGITGGVSSEVDTSLPTIIERVHRGTQTCVKSTSLTRSPKTTP